MSFEKFFPDPTYPVSQLTMDLSARCPSSDCKGIDNVASLKNDTNCLLLSFYEAQKPTDKSGHSASCPPALWRFNGSKNIYIAVLLLSLSVPLVYRPTQSYVRSLWQAFARIPMLQAATTMSNSLRPNGPSRTPVYFLSIGGPNTMEDTEHPAYAKLGAVGREITTKVKPKAVVVFSAHWQGDGPNKISVNVAEQTDLIYDFYGFPPHYYEYKFPYKGSPAVAEKVIAKLTGVGAEVERVERGLDHGVWAGFIVGMRHAFVCASCLRKDTRGQILFFADCTLTCLLTAFDPKKNPLNVPIVQVSLYGSEDPDRHYRLGQALQSLRDEGILIVTAGMAVHNLRDFRATRGSGGMMP